MDARTVELERDYELPRGIVWDALIDEELVSGWLAEAEIEPEPGGRYALHWTHREPQARTEGRIIAMDAPHSLLIETREPSTIRFDLLHLDGGSRGTSTRLRVSLEVFIDRAFESRLLADWLTNLDQLEDLLRGHPVDWAEWTRDRHLSWSTHLTEVENSTA
ncbi:MAG: SRPBCC domain-containing protein [Salinibacterium sp.]|nr:SRPBCC domain-containing protein [Salinibacterium sp.]